VDRLPRTAAVQGQLADHDLQRQAPQRQPDRARSRLSQRARADHLHRPGRNPEGARRAIRIPHRSEDPADRGRCRDPARRIADDRQTLDLQGGKAELRERLLPERTAPGESRSRIHRLDQTERIDLEELPGEGMRRRLGVALVAGALALLVGAAAALAITTQIGPLKVSATGESAPRAFPAHGTVPTTFTSTVHIRALNGKAPPALKSLTFEFDKHGRINFKGVPTCTAAKLEGATPSEARSRCAGALVGTGIGKARVALPGKPPFTMSSPISTFTA